MIRWADAARRQNKPVRAFLAWAAGFTAHYFHEEAVQAFHRKADPIPTGSTHYYTLVYLPTLRLLATFRTAKHCKEPPKIPRRFSSGFRGKISRS